MKRSTIEFAKSVVEAQRNNYLEHQSDAQFGYYEGMRAMLEIILTEGYTKTVECVPK